MRASQATLRIKGYAAQGLKKVLEHSPDDLLNTAVMGLEFAKIQEGEVYSQSKKGLGECEELCYGPRPRRIACIAKQAGVRYASR